MVKKNKVGNTHINIVLISFKQTHDALFSLKTTNPGNKLIVFSTN